MELPPLPPMSRKRWRIIVVNRLMEMGALFAPNAHGAWEVFKGDSYLMLTDLADLNERELDRLARS